LCFGKGLFDRSFAIVGLVVLLPLFLLISIIVKIDSKGSVFFCHQRIGKHFQPFLLFKFRSMDLDSFELGPVITQGRDPRITRCGKYLRKYKIDELPQLFNVLLGHISIVGPRPEVEKYVRLFHDKYSTILQIKPGITDYAALEYRNEELILEQFVDIEKAYKEVVLPSKILLYEKYLKKVSFREDVRIVFLTLWKIFF